MGNDKKIDKTAIAHQQGVSTVVNKELMQRVIDFICEAVDELRCRNIHFMQIKVLAPNYLQKYFESGEYMKEVSRLFGYWNVDKIQWCSPHNKIYVFWEDDLIFSNGDNTFEKQL